MTPLPAFARIQQMTTTEKKQRVDEIQRLHHALSTEGVNLQLQIEEEEDRPESLRAKWCRAWLAHDMDECGRILALEFPQVVP